MTGVYYAANDAEFDLFTSHFAGMTTEIEFGYSLMPVPRRQG